MTELKSHNGYYLWHYLPSTPAAAIFCVLFAIATIAHFWRLFKTRAWFCLAFTLGALCTILLPRPSTFRSLFRSLIQV